MTTWLRHACQAPFHPGLWGEVLCAAHTQGAGSWADLLQQLPKFLDVGGSSPHDRSGCVGRPGMDLHSYFDPAFLECHHVPDPVLDAEDTAVNRVDKTLALLGLTV